MEDRAARALPCYRGNRISGWRKTYVFKIPTSDVVAVYDDYTSQKTSEERLKESEDKFRSLFEQSPDALVFYSKDTYQIIDFNPSMNRNLGYTREEMTKLNVNDLKT